MRILLSPVGQRDPTSADSEQEGASLTLCRHLKPDVVYLLPTADRPDVSSSTAANASALQERLRDILPAAKAYVKPLDVSNPTDYYQVLPQVKSIVKGVMKESAGFGEREFFLNASSGTQQIQIACLLAITSGLLPARAFQVADPRFAPAHERVTELPVTLFFEDQLVERVYDLYDRRMFDACVEELKALKALTQHRQRRDVVETWIAVCEAYNALDRLDYGVAVGRLDQARARTEGTLQYAGIARLLSKQVTALKQLKESSQENSLVLTDIYHNAARRQAQANHADALARVWRLLEGGMFCYLRQTYGIEPSELAKSASPENAAKLICLRNGEVPKRISFEDSRKALAEVFKDVAFLGFLAEKKAFCSQRTEKLGSLMDTLRQRRNESVVAHGVRGVERETAEKGLQLARAFLLFLFPDSKPDDHPFAAGQLQSVGQTLRLVAQQSG